MNEIRTKAPDEKFCSECGEIIRLAAEICPKCGVRQSGINQVDSFLTGNNLLYSSKMPKIFGLINIIFGSLYLIKHVFIFKSNIELISLALNLKDSSFLFSFLYEMDLFLPIILFFVYMGIIISGIGLLKYETWGRQIAIFLAPIIILITVLSNKKFFQYHNIDIDGMTFLLIMFDLLLILLSMSYLFAFHQKAFRESLK